MLASVLEVLLVFGLPLFIIVYFSEGMLIGKFLPTAFLLPSAIIIMSLSPIYSVGLIFVASGASTMGQITLFSLLVKYDSSLESIPLLFNENKINKKAEYIFDKYSSEAIMVCNLIPLVRGSSILTTPTETSVKQFSLYSAIGNVTYYSSVTIIFIGVTAFLA